MKGRLIRALAQGAILILCGSLVAALALEARRNLAARHIATGFGFLWQPASIPLGETPIPYTPTVSAYGRALAVGLLNTLKLAGVGIVAATLWGGLIGLARRSRDPLLRRVSGAYVEIVRDVPLLLHLLFWYGLLLLAPPPHDAWRGAGLWLCDRGLYVPWPGAEALRLGRFNVEGGASVTPEYLALLIGLVLYTAAYVAEIVRAGLEAVPRGQWEAAAALGLPRRTALLRVAGPPALRVMLPPLASQYMNLLKNTSLAVAVGYQDLVSVADTTLNQTGQAIEGVAIVMGTFLTLNLGIGLAMGGLERRLARRGA